MPETKTRPTLASVDDYLASRASAEQLADCKDLIVLLSKITQEPPTMWGPSIVGFGTYRYTYDSGHSGVSCLTGFAVRGRELVVYLFPTVAAEQGLLASLGKHKLGKGCLYFKRLSDLDIGVLETLVVESVGEITRRYTRE